MKTSLLRDIFLSFVIFFCMTPPADAQKRKSQWFFGSEHLSFGLQGNDWRDTLYHSPVDLSPAYSPAVALHPFTGELLFITDGISVYNRALELMENGSLPQPAQSKAKALALSPIPSSLYQQFLLFVNRDLEIVSYTIDMQHAGDGTELVPYGRVSEEAQSVAPSSALFVKTISFGENHFLLSQHAVTQALEVRRINAQGSTDFVDSLNIDYLISDLAFNPDNGLLAAVPNRTANFGLFSFDGTELSRHVIPEIPESASLRGVKQLRWIANDSLIAEGRNNLFVISIDNSSQPEPLHLSNHPIERSLDIQLGPDKKLYHLYQEASGTRHIARIDLDEYMESGGTPNIDYAVFQAETETSLFPNFLPSPALNPEGFTFEIKIPENSCTYNTIPLYTIIQYNERTVLPDSIRWFINSEPRSGLHPLVEVEEELEAEAVAFFDNLAIPSRLLQRPSQNPLGEIIIENPLLPNEHLSDTTICPGIVLDLPVKIKPQEDGNSGGQGGGQGGNSSAQPPNGKPVIWSTSETSDNILIGWNTGDPSENHSGEYFVVVYDDTGSGCYRKSENLNVTIYAQSALQTAAPAADQMIVGKWYFGDRAAYNFNNLPPETPGPLNNNQLNTPAGVETVFNDEGNLLFHTNGDEIWARHRTVADSYPDSIMRVAAQIGGDPESSVAVKAVPLQRNSNFYYVFTTQKASDREAMDLRYSIVNVFSPNLADLSFRIDTLISNVPIYSCSSERILTNSSGLTSRGIFNKMAFNNQFAFFTADDDGLHFPVFSLAGPYFLASQQNALKGELAEISGGAQGNRLFMPYNDARTPDDPQENRILVLSEDSTSFREVENLLIPNSEGMTPYGAEGGQSALFVSLNGPGRHEIHAYDMLDSLFASPLSSSFELGDISTAPDNQIYAAEAGQAVLQNLLLNPQNEVVYNSTPIDLAGNPSTLGLPSFTTTPQGDGSDASVSATAERFCLGDTTYFRGNLRTKIDDYIWDFGTSNTNFTQLPYNENKPFAMDSVNREDPNNSFVLSKGQYQSAGLYPAKIYMYRCVKTDLDTAQNPIVPQRIDELPAAFPDSLLFDVVDVQPNPIGIYEIAPFNFQITEGSDFVNASGGTFFSCGHPFTVQAFEESDLAQVDQIQWINEQTGTAFNDDNDYRFELPIERMMFRVEAQLEACRADTILGVNDLKVEIGIPDDLHFCQDEEGFIKVDVDTSIYNIQWYREDELMAGENSTLLPINTSEADSANFSILASYIEEDFCVSGDTVLVAVTENPEPVITDNSEFTTCFNELQSPEILNVGSFSAYEWLHHGSSIYNTEELSISDSSQVGSYTVTVTDSLGCRGQKDFSVADLCEPIIVMPNAFHPDREINKKFRIGFDKNIDENTFAIYIYNRWGELIFHSSDYESFRPNVGDTEFTQGGWDGTDKNGNVVPKGAYPYVITYRIKQVNSSEEIRQRGTVFVIR